MNLSPEEPPGVDPYNVPETLCIGKFNLSVGASSLVTLTFTHIRNKTGPMLDEAKVVQESVVRARIVTTMENMIAMRDLLNKVIQDHPGTTAVAGGTGKPN